MSKAVLTKAATLAVAASFVVGAAAACSGNSSANGLPSVSLMVGGIDKQIYLPYELARTSASTRSTG